MAAQAMSDKLQKIQRAYQGDKKQVAAAQVQSANKDEKLVQGYEDKSPIGNRAKFLYNELLSGVGDIASGLGDVGTQLFTRGLPGGGVASPNYTGRTPEEEYSAAEAIKDYRENVAPKIREYLKEKIGSEEAQKFENNYRNETLTSALGGLARTVPAIAAASVSGGAGGGALFLQSYDNALATLDQSEAGRELDDATKTIYATGIGIVSSALEKFGLDKIMKGETGIVSKLLADRALKNAVKKTGGQVTGDVFTKFLNKEIVDLSGKFAKGGAKALDGYLTEAFTGGAQEAATIAGENLLNETTGKPVFDMKDTNSWGGFLRRVGSAANAEGIGGGLLGTVAALGGFKRGDIEAKEQQIKDIDAAISNEEIGDVAKEVLVQNKIKLQTEIQDIADNIDQTYDKLDQAQKEQVNQIIENRTKLDAAIADPNVSEEIKSSLQEQSNALDDELSKIKPTEETNAKKAPEYFDQYESAVNSAKSSKEAFKEVTKDGAVLSDTFNRKYNPDGTLTPQETFDKFYNEIKPSVKENTGTADPSGKNREITVNVGGENYRTDGNSYIISEKEGLVPIGNDDGANGLSQKVFNEYESAKAAMPKQTEQTIKTDNEKDISEVYNASDRISKEGTPEQYSSYVDGIFPDSKVKEIVYHGTNAEFDTFEQGHKDTRGHKTDTVGFHFIEKAGAKEYESTFGKMRPVKLDFRNPIISEDSERFEYLKADDVAELRKQGYDSAIVERPWEREFIAFSPEQIHMLGNKNDAEQFKQYKESKERLVQNHKQGVDFAFDKQPKLADIGTKKEYGAYIENIFPKSSLNDVVYRGDDFFESNGSSYLFDKSSVKSNDDSVMYGIYFTSEKDVADSYSTKKGNTNAAVINMENFKKLYVPHKQSTKQHLNGDLFWQDLTKEQLLKLKEEGYDGVTVDSEPMDVKIPYSDEVTHYPYRENLEVIVFDPSQIHVLGSEKDMQDFKKWKESNNSSTIGKEDISSKVLSKAEDDLKALKQVDNKKAKYDASIKRLTEAKNNKNISAKEFDELKSRFDDVMADSKQIKAEDAENNAKTPLEESKAKKANETNKEIIYTDSNGNKKQFNVSDLRIDESPETRYQQGIGEINTIELKAGDNKIGELQFRANDDGTATVVFASLENQSLKRKGLGTFLYEESAKSIKKTTGLDMVSDFDLDDSTRGLWEKLVKEDKAELVNDKNDDISDHVYRFISKDKKSNTSSKTKQSSEQILDGRNLDDISKNIGGQAAISNGVIKNIFEKNPKIKDVGSAEEYKRYTETIFPDSKLRGEFYHNSSNTFDKFDIGMLGKSSFDKGWYGQGIYLGIDPKRTQRFGDKQYHTLLDIKNPFTASKSNFEKLYNEVKQLGIPKIYFDRQDLERITQYENEKYSEEITKAIKKLGFDSSINGYQIVVFDPNSIHILGNESDISAFRKWKSDNNRSPIEKVLEKRADIKSRISEKLKSQRGNLSSGFDPSLIKDFIELGATYIEEGIVTAEEFIKRFRKDYKDIGFDDKELTDADIKAEIFDKVSGKAVEESEKTVGLTKEDVRILREELGQDQYEYEVLTNATRIAEAKRMIEDGYNIANLLKRVEKRGVFDNAVEVEIAKQYYASLTDQIDRNPTPELIQKRNDLLSLIDLAKTEGGRISQAWDGLTAKEDNLANFLTEESRYVELDQQQINELIEKYNKAKETLAKYEQMQTDAINSARDKKASNEIEKAKRTGDRRLVKEAYKNERKKYVEDFRAELRKIRQTPSAVVLPYSRELIAAAPFVRKMMQSYVNEGIYNLQKIVKGIHKEFRQDIPGLTENDVRDMIAGEYRNPKQTRNAKLAEIRDLERQAKLENEIEKLKDGIIETKEPRVKRAKSDKITELEGEIKKLRKLHPELTIPSRLQGRKTWLTNRINELKDQIRKGDYEPVEPPAPILLDQEALKLKDEYIKFKEETRARRQMQEEKALSGWNKAIKYGQEALATKRLVQTSIDLSIPFRQGISVMANVGIPFINKGTLGIGADAYAKMLSSVKSEKNYDRMMFDIEHNPKYLEAKDDGIVFNEVGSLNPEKRDEFHRDHFLYKAPLLGKALKASERAAAAWTNYARMELYLRGAKILESVGKTRENSKEAYEQMAARVMVDTGRGKIPGIKDKNAGETDSRVKRILGNTFYGARLMSATFRKLNPLYYFNPKVDRTVRIQALKDMAGYTTGLVALGLATSALGYGISFDPDDPDFMKLRKGKEVIDITGGQATYIRTYLRLVRAAMMQANPDVSHEDAVKYSNFAKQSTGNFFRNKLAPNTSYVMNFLSGENSMGEKFDPLEIVKIYPMYTDDIIKSFKEGSPVDLLTIIPISISGLGYQTYEKDIRKAKLDYHLQDKALGKWLKSKQLNITGDINQEVFNTKTGDKERMTKEQYDRFEKIWADYITDELKEQQKAFDGLKPKELKKQVNKIKVEASKYAKYEVAGNLSGVGTVSDDGKVYELAPAQIAKRIKIANDYISDYGDELKESYTESFIEEGMGRNRAKRKAAVKLQTKANNYSGKIILDQDKEANNGKITLKEKEL